MYDEEKELYKTLDELGYVFSVETGGWYPKDHNPNSVHMNTLEALDWARRVMYRDDVRQEEREGVK